MVGTRVGFGYIEIFKVKASAQNYGLLVQSLLLIIWVQKKLLNGYYYFNERSKKMQLKIGYKIVGEKTNYCPALNSEVREILTKLKKSDFDKYYNSIDFEFSVQ